MQIPSDVSPGQPISAKDYNALLRYVRSLEPKGGIGVRVQRSISGTTISATEQGSGPAAKLAIVHPFMVTDASTATAAIVRVRSGSVNDSIPTGIDPGDQTLDSWGIWRIYLDCTLNTDATGAVTAVAVAKVNGAQPENTRTHAYITLATATVAAITGGFSITAIHQLATHSLRFYACGRTESEDGSYNFWGF